MFDVFLCKYIFVSILHWRWHSQKPLGTAAINFRPNLQPIGHYILNHLPLPINSLPKIFSINLIFIPL